MQFELPSPVSLALDRLEEAGYASYAVGGLGAGGDAPRL